MTLSVCCMTVDPPGQVATALGRLRPVADEILVLVNSVVPPEALGPYAAVADRVWRYDFRLPIERPRPWLFAQCRGDWILFLDGDEVPSQALVDRLPELVEVTDAEQYWFPRRWLFPDPGTWLAELPWWPDFQLRLVRNSATLGLRGDLHGGIAPVLPNRHCDAPLYHLDCVLKDEAQRRTKVAEYAGENPVRHAYGGGLLNPTLYLPEDQNPGDVRPVPAEDRDWIDDVLAARECPPVSAVVDAALVPVAEIDALEVPRRPPDSAYRAGLELFDRDPRMAPGELRPVYIRVENRGTVWWPWGWEQEPHIRVGYHWRSADGEMLTYEGIRSPLTARLGPGASQIVPVWVQAPEEPGQYLLEFDLVHEFVRWFETPLVVEMCVAERGRC